MSENFDIILNSALYTWLWSETDDNGEPMDADYDIEDIAPETVAKWREDIQAFLNESILDVQDMDPSQIGHDFALTRNRHGAGFWDRGLGDRGLRLTESAQALRECSAYVGDDGKVYAA